MSGFKVLLILLLILAFGLGVTPFFFLLYFCLAIFVWSRWSARLALRHVSVARDVPALAFCDKENGVRILIRNGSFVSLPWLEVSEGIAYELRSSRSINEVVALPGYGATLVDYTVNPSKRGRYDLGPMYLSGGDLFGFFREQRAIGAQDAVIVCPRIHSLTRLLLSSQQPFGSVMARRLPFRDPTAVTSLRSYRRGDRVGDINWKVSARARELVVRVCRSSNSIPAMILIDLHRGSYHDRSWRRTAEWAIEVAASLAMHVTGLRQPIGLATSGLFPAGARPGAEMPAEALGKRNDSGQHTPSDLLPPRMGRRHLLAIMAQLAQIEAGDTVPFEDWADGACTRLTRGTTVFAITPFRDRETAVALGRLLRRGLSPVLVVTAPGQPFLEARAMARQFGFAAYGISKPADLERWQLLSQRQGQT